MRLRSVPSTILAVLFCLGDPVLAYSGDGDGSSEKPFEIATKADLLELAADTDNYDKCFILTANIDLTGNTLTQAVIAQDTDSAKSGFQGTQFAGIFDGNGKTISNAVINHSGSDYVGLFGRVGSSGQIKNLGIVDIIINGHDNVGRLVGENNGTITSCYATGMVSGRYYVGGLVGRNESGTIISCYATGNVSGTGYYVGGLVGYNESGMIISCYATGNVSGTGYYVGGLVGLNYYKGTITSCLWDIQTSGQSSSFGGKGLTTAQMKTLSIYQNAGWAGKGWVINDGFDYPHLSWESTGGTEIPSAVIPFAGSGTEIDPYRITTEQEFALLSWYSGILDKQIRLEAGLDLGGIILHPIGDLGQFTGVFDGNGKTVSNPVINQPGGNRVGLFGTLGADGQIKNLGVESANIQGSSPVGGLVGWNYGTITSCYATGNVSGTEVYVGGLVGLNLGTLTSCYSTGNVTGTGYSVGGLVGSNYDTITSCYATGTVGGSDSVGGLVGSNHATITSCYATGAVSGSDSVGGLVGRNYQGKLIRCYSTGKPTGTTNIGGLSGQITTGENYEDTGNFWDKESSMITTSAMGTGKSTAEMQNASTFIGAGWDFETPVWMISGADYPRLVWNKTDINDSGKVDSADLFMLAANWLSPDCGFCSGVDLTGDRNINLYDLQVFAADWLSEDKIGDHVFEMKLSVGWDYESPTNPSDDTYDFELDIVTDDQIVKIEVLTPKGKVLNIPSSPIEYNDAEGNDFYMGREFDSEDNRWEWWYEAEYVSRDGLALYGDGDYIITVYYESGRSQQTTAWFGVPGTSDAIPQPTQQPIITSFADGATLVSPFAVNWQDCTDPNASLIWLDAEYENDTYDDVEIDLPTDTAGLDEPLSLESGQWEISLGFATYYVTHNSDGIIIDIAKCSESDYVITVVEDSMQ